MWATKVHKQMREQMTSRELKLDMEYGGGDFIICG